MQKILVATDGSVGAKHAVVFAAKLAGALHATLTLLHVAGNSSEAQLEEISRVEQDMGEAIAMLSDLVLKEAESEAKSTGLSKVAKRSGWGDPTESICNIASSEKVDLLVVGRRGRGQLAGLLLGSVSQKLAGVARCPLIIVP